MSQRVCRGRTAWVAAALVGMSLVLGAATAAHLGAASTAWVTPFHAAVSIGLVALALVALGAIVTGHVGARIAVPIALLGANVGFIAAHLAGEKLVAFAAYPSNKFSITLSLATLIGAVGLARRRMWARWMYLALGAAAIGSGGLNLINFWGASGQVDAAHRAWSMLVLEQTWGFALSVVAGVVIVACLAPIGAAFSAGRNHATWTSDAAVVRTLRLLVVACLAAIPMLLVYAWIQPLVPATRPTALALAAVLTLGVVLAVRGKLAGALVLTIGGLGLAAQTVATYLLAAERVQPVTRYYAAFWLPAAVLALVTAAHLGAPLARLLRR